MRTDLSTELGICTAGIQALAVAVISCVIAAQLSTYSKLHNNILLPLLPLSLTLNMMLV